MVLSQSEAPAKVPQFRLAKLRERFREQASKVAGAPAVADASGAEPAGHAQTGSMNSAAPTGLAAIISASPNRFPLDVTARYRGKDIDAVILATGVVVYDGDEFTSPSTAAKEARKRSGYLGTGTAATNGWVFWRFVDEDGIEKPLQALRESSFPANP